MTRIVVSGASGNLGRKITDQLLERMVPADLTLVTRSPRNLADRARPGVTVHAGDYNDPAALGRAPALLRDMFARCKGKDYDAC